MFWDFLTTYSSNLCTYLIYFILKLKRKNKSISRVFNKLNGAPQRKGLVIRIVLRTPKKPNSALRHLAKTVIYKNSKLVFGRIPGIGSIPTKYNRVLVEGGRANDIPTVRLTLVRNVYDFSGLYNKKKRRSVYGTPRLENYTAHVRRKYRKILGIN